MLRPSLALLGLYCTLAWSAARPASERIVVPADKTDTYLDLQLNAAPSKGASISVGPLKDSTGSIISMRPVAEKPSVLDDTLHLHLVDMFFWGEAKLNVSVGDAAYVCTLQRGPALANPDVRAVRNAPSSLWLYNFDTHPLKFRWRIVSGADTLCGIEPNGQTRRQCEWPDRWPEATLAAVQSDSISFVAPDSWFDPLNAFDGRDVRQAQLELRFGDGDNAQLLRTSLTLHLETRLLDAFPLWMPWIGSTWRIIRNVLWVLFWVTLGAVLLMLAQVMIPNFRRCLRMENQIEGLEQRLRSIGNRCGGTLYTRSEQELDSVRFSLAMERSSTKSRFRSWERLALAGNTAEVNRLDSLLPRIESRIRLTERLDEAQAAALEDGLGEVPPSICWNRTKLFRNVQAILTRQFLTDGDEKSASDSLAALTTDGGSMKDFVPELETRIAGLRRQFAMEPWKTKYPNLVGALNGCAELLQQTPASIPDGGWTNSELILRDLSAIRLSLVHRIILLDSLLDAKPGLRETILKKLESNEPSVLDDARNDLVKLAQSLSDQDVRTALEEGMWDAYCEPAMITDQDVLRCSFVFRNKDLNRCAAKNSFQCFWRTTAGDPASPDDLYERGWEIQFIPSRGVLQVTPEVYDSHGNAVAIRDSSEDTKNKGVVTFEVVPPPSNTLTSRLLRGLIDASITAVVPVVTVAITQVQNGGQSDIGQLVLLGFTSQAIRAAVIPESVSTPLEPAKSAAVVQRTA